MCSKEVPKRSSEKHARAVALFVLNSGSRTSHALDFGILDRQKSVTPVFMLGFFLCPCCRFTFFLRVYLWRGCAAELCSHARGCYDMLWVLFGSTPSLAGGTLIVLECHRRQGKELSIAHSLNGILYFIYFEEITHWGPGDSDPRTYFSLTLNRQRNYTKLFSVKSS